MNPLNILYRYFKRGITYVLHGIPNNVVTARISVLSQTELLKGRCALITGGTSGIGYSIAQSYLKAGATVIITGRNESKLKKTVESLQAEGMVFGFKMDNCDIKAFKSIFNEMLATVNKAGIKQIDILVNNAGVQGAELPNAIEDGYDSVLDTNLKAVFFLSQLFGNYMVKNKIKGNILNIASSSSLRPAITAYTISKWGIRGLTMGLARSLVSHGITVNGLAPGATATPMLNRKDGENLNYPYCLMGRYILPEEIANMAVFLVSDMGRSIVGDIIYMTGGMGLISFEDMNYNVFKTNEN
jgi:Dehydrogenases with different specificities (related to short-chain alcohol dehydrogenases)